MDASAENFQFLDYFVDRWVVNISRPPNPSCSARGEGAAIVRRMDLQITKARDIDLLKQALRP